MGSENTELPPGHRFNPFEHELIEFYLKPKVLGEKLLSNVVEEKKLYGSNANPWQIFNPHTHPWILSEVSVGKFEKVAYVFVNLTKKAVNSGNKKLKSNSGREQFIKKAGCGTWDGQTKRTEIRDFKGDLIGERRMLVFEINEELEDFSGLGHWRMHEYSLCGANKDIPNPANTVLCKITLDSSKCPAIKLHPHKTIHPVKATISQKKNKDTQKVDNIVCSSSITNCNLTTQSCCDGGLVTIDCGSKGEEKVDANVSSSSITNCDVTTQSCCDGGLVIDCYGSKGEEDWCYEIDDDWIYSLLASEQGGVSFQCPSYPDQLVDDFTTNLGKRKLNVETSYEMMRSLMALFSPKLKDT